MDLSKMYNPYDFAHPVSDAELFVGRKDELEEIKYYLDHAKTAPNPINIALLGPRTSGKTSLLNMCDFEAKRRGFCAVRIDLDEDDAKTQLGFFYKVFDGILLAACEFGAFGGRQGKTYDTYLDIVNTYSVPEDKTFCPFLFPLQYAKAMGSRNVNASLSDNSYRGDLVKIRSELNRPIVLLFDEGNVLANSRVHLEKLRNIFMNIPGFMLVFTGTPNLFPVMDDVFSPIVRQFKKISIDKFKDEKETEQCIRKPLEKTGIEPEGIFDFETYRDVREIHDLSSGRPYEIQLICHVLFRRIQCKRARKMKLDLGVLEDVRKELETSQDITTRPVLTRIRNIDSKQLSALNLLCACDGYATFDQIWAIEYIFKNEKSWTKDTLHKELQYLVKEGIVGIKEGIIEFAGDDFDKIYAKYFAREQGVPLSFPDRPLNVFWYVRLRSFLKSIKNLTAIPGIVISGNVDLIDIATKIASSSKDVFVESPPIVEDLYFCMLDYQGKETMPIVLVKIILPWLNVQSWFYAENPNDVTPVDSCLQKIESLTKRVNRMGGNLALEKKELPVVPVEVLAQKVEYTANERFREWLALRHELKMIEAYVEEANVDKALVHAKLLYRYNPNPEPSTSNNLGYFFMSVGDLDKARNLLENAANSYKEPHESALPNYNLGVLEAKCGRFKEALAKINLSIEQIKDTSKGKREMSCLFVPEIINGKLEFREVREEPDLLEVASEAKTNLERFLTDTSE